MGQLKPPDWANLECQNHGPGFACDGTHIVRLDPTLNALIAPGRPIGKVADGFTFTEGPMWHEAQLLISDIAGEKTYALSADRSVNLLLDKSGGYATPPCGAYLRPDAMVTDKDGTVLFAQQGGRKIGRIGRVGGHLELRPFLFTYGGRIQQPKRPCLRTE